jgi:predicted O-methyltransferase YrrM
MPDTISRALAPLADFPPGVSADAFQHARASRAYSDLMAFFQSWPSHSLMSDEGRATLYALIRMMRPSVVVEVGTLFAGTTQVMARALWENGSGVVHTTDPFGADRCPGIIDAWPRELQALTTFYPLNSMAFFERLAQQRVVPDLVFVDGNHDFEFALFDLQSAARLIRPGGVVIVDDADQSGPFHAARAFMASVPGWRELGSALAAYDPAQPFAAGRASVPDTGYLILQAPAALTVGDVPRSWNRRVEETSVIGFALDLPAQHRKGRLSYQVIFRSFGDGNRTVDEWKSVGAVSIALDGHAAKIACRLPQALSSDMRARYADAAFMVEIELALQGDGPLTLNAVPSPL